MKKIKAGVCLIMAFLLAGMTGCKMTDKNIRFGAAGVGGSYYTFATAYTQLVSQEDDKIQFDVKTTAGSMANLRLLSEGYIDIAIAQADLVNENYYESEETPEYKVLAGLYTEACHIVVRKDSDIFSLEDLQGKRISIGEKESGTEQNALQILQVCGLVDSIVDTVNLDYIEAAKQLEDGEIDAMFCIAGIEANVIADVSKSCEIRLLDIDDKTIQKLQLAYPFYEAYEIPKDSYVGQDKKVQTVGIKALLLAGNDVSNQTAKRLTELLFSNATRIKYATAIEDIYDEQEAVNGITIPFHEGALEYYEEQGVRIEGNENKEIKNGNTN